MVIKKPLNSRGFFISKAGNGIRTRDTLLGKQVLYQLSYTRMLENIIGRSSGTVKDDGSPLLNTPARC